MKKIYWRPHQVSRIELILIAVIALVGIFLVETMHVSEIQPYFEEKIDAAKLSREAMQVIKTERLRRGYRIDKEADPAESGMVGILMSDVTANSGVLPAKQTTINPNFAAVVVHLLKQAGAEEGDTVAVGFSGSFPCLNIATMAAIKVLNLDPVIISSVSGSQWGANIPNFLWIDMERVLNKAGLFDFHSIAGSRGGVDDRALGLAKRGKRLLDDTIERNGLLEIKEPDYISSLERRMDIYQEFAGASPIKAYINVGGGSISVGTREGKKAFRPGLNRNMPNSPLTVDSVIGRMSMAGIPVIHLVRINTLAERYGLPIQPLKMPPVGEGKIFSKMEYNPWLAPIALAAILLAMIAFIRTDWGFRIFQTGRTKKERKPPEQMV
jgi:poly-gamma-glutamate system protein